MRQLKIQSRFIPNPYTVESCVASSPNDLGTHKAVFLRRRTARLRHNH